MKSIGFGRSFNQLSAIVVAFALFSPPNLIAQERSNPRTLEIDPSRYVECHNLLNSEPLNQLSQHVAEGRGSRISDSELGKPLIGVACSDAQIINYMEHHGFVRGVLFTWREPKEHALLGPYNKLLNFHVRSQKNWLHRKLHGEWAVVASFMMLNDTVLNIASGAHK